MIAYEKYLLMLSEQGVKECPDMTQTEVLTILIRQALLDRNAMAHELMEKAGQRSYNKESFEKAAAYLLREGYTETT